MAFHFLPSTRIDGVPVLEVRDFLRSERDDARRHEPVVTLPKQKERQQFLKLARSRFLMHPSETRQIGLGARHTPLTPLGEAVSEARFTSRFPLTEADPRADMLMRSVEMDATAQLGNATRIRWWAYGSWAARSHVVGNLDLAMDVFADEEITLNIPVTVANQLDLNAKVLRSRGCTCRQITLHDNGYTFGPMLESHPESTPRKAPRRMTLMTDQGAFHDGIPDGQRLVESLRAEILLLGKDTPCLISPDAAGTIYRAMEDLTGRAFMSIDLAATLRAVWALYVSHWVSEIDEGRGVAISGTAAGFLKALGAMIELRSTKTDLEFAL